MDERRDTDANGCVAHGGMTATILETMVDYIIRLTYMVLRRMFCTRQTYDRLLGV